MIRRRRVVYLMGFDPRGSQFYYQLLKREASRSKRRGFSHINIGPLQHGELFSQCDWQQQDGPGGDYRFAEMLDLIEPHFRPMPGACWWWWLQLSFHMLKNQMLWQRKGQSWQFSLFMCYPLLFFLLLLAALTGLSLSLSSLAGGLCSLPLWFSALLLGTDVALRRFDQRLYLRYLLGDFLFTKAVLSAQWQDLELRLQHWADQLADDARQLTAEEELLIVGHSSGGLLATRLVALLRARLSHSEAARCTLLTLGNQASTGLAPKAVPFHQAVATVTGQQELAWLEIFAPQDVICSGRFEPGVLPGASRGRVRLMSALWREALDPEEYHKARWKFFQLHMQYLRSGSTGAGFDYFQLLAAPHRSAQYQPKRAPRAG